MGDRNFDDGMMYVGDRPLSNYLKKVIAFLMMGLMWTMLKPPLDEQSRKAYESLNLDLSC